MKTAAEIDTRLDEIEMELLVIGDRLLHMCERLGIGAER